MSIPRIMIAAPKSGSGKTLITCALLGALKKRNIDVVSCKCGPDYIDPMFHRTVLGVPSENLDTYFTGEDKTRQIFASFSKGHDMAVMEGVMGLYDGVGGIEEAGSSYHLAKVTKTPVILVVDAHGMGRSVLSVISGFKYYDKDNLIKGIILNRISKSFYENIKEITEKETGIKLLGFFENNNDFYVPERHLGLTLPAEIEDIRSKISHCASLFEETVDVDKIIEISKCMEGENPVVNKDKIYKAEERLNLAVARDEAFCFYYDANIRILEKMGVVIKYFSPIHDGNLPEDIDGILLGGGYPELYAYELSKNVSMLEDIKFAINNDIPSLAECGGFMYLHKTLKDENGNSYNMAGVIDKDIFYAGKLVRFGYIEMLDKKEVFLKKGSLIRGHEFHYYNSTDNGTDVKAVKPVTEKSWECCYTEGNHWWGFPHLYYPSCEEFAEAFVEKMKAYRHSNNGV